MYYIFVNILSLVLSFSQNYLRNNEEIDSLSFCFPMDSPFIPNNSKYELEILCYGEECYGQINKNQQNLFENITFACNQLNCNFIENEEGQYSNNDICENCTEIIITCFKGKCLGGFTKNDNKNKNESNYEENSVSLNNNYNDSYNNNEKRDLYKNSFNKTLIKINCLGKKCYTYQINEINDINNKNDSGIFCEYGDGPEKEESEEKGKKEKEKEEIKKKYIIIIVIGYSWIFLIIISVIIIACFFKDGASSWFILLITLAVIFIPITLICAFFGLIIVIIMECRYSNKKNSDKKEILINDNIDNNISNVDNEKKKSEKINIISNVPDKENKSIINREKTIKYIGGTKNGNENKIYYNKEKNKTINKEKTIKFHIKDTKEDDKDIIVYDGENKDTIKEVKIIISYLKNKNKNEINEDKIKSNIRYKKEDEDIFDYDTKNINTINDDKTIKFNINNIKKDEDIYDYNIKNKFKNMVTDDKNIKYNIKNKKEDKDIFDYDGENKNTMNKGIIIKSNVDNQKKDEKIFDYDRENKNTIIEDKIIEHKGKNKKEDEHKLNNYYSKNKNIINEDKTIKTKKIKKKEKIIQNHSYHCNIERINGELYLVNYEEVKITLLLVNSLKLSRNDIIVVYTFNIAQVEILKEQFKDKLSFINIILFNEECTNFCYSDYIIINYIDSDISLESKQKYPFFKSQLNSKKFFTEEFTNHILKKFTKKSLYLVCNYEYLKRNNNENLNNEDNKDNDNYSKNALSNKKNYKDNNLEIPKAKISREIVSEKINRDYVTNEYNVCFLIDNTGSMRKWINIVKSLCNNLFTEIVKKYNKYIFYFGCVLYADKFSIETDKNFIVDFTQDENKFKNDLEKIELQDGDDSAEDWVTGFEMTLEDLKWVNGTKLIFHIADAPAHGKIFNIDKKNDNFLNNDNDIHGKNLIKLIKKCSQRNIKITGININNVGSFKVFKQEYEKVKGPKYEIIGIDGAEIINGNDYIKRKIFEIIEESINNNKNNEPINFKFNNIS